MNTTNLRIPSNKVRDIERYFLTELASLYPEAEIRQMVRMLFEAYLGWETATYLLHRNETINQSDLLKFHWAAEALRQEKPIQQIIGSTSFANCSIQVSPDVLIPRPETEEIVFNIIQTLNLQHANKQPNDSELNFVDLCCGSGCIGIAIAKAFPHAHVYGFDISEKALAVATANASDNHVNVTFQRCDILNTFPNTPIGPVDLIVSNPPYIRKSERVQMKRNVLDYEPEIALFVEDNDPLRFYRRIGEYAAKQLAPTGHLVLEINEALADSTCALLREFGFLPSCFQDFRGKDRCICAKLQ